MGRESLMTENFMAMQSSPMGRIGQSKGLARKWLYMEKGASGNLVKRKVGLCFEFLDMTCEGQSSRPDHWSPAVD